MKRSEFAYRVGKTNLRSKEKKNMSILPNKRPVIKQTSAEKVAKYFLGDEWKNYDVVEIAVRQKKINFYDDELAVITKNAYQTFNWNAEPSAYIVKGKPKAILRKGVHFYTLGYHHKWKNNKRYVALRPATVDESLPVWRTDKNGKLFSDKGIAINQHRGGANSTWSEGCQTAHLSQYDEFIGMIGDAFGYKVPKGIIAKPEAKLLKGIGRIPYILIDQADFNYIIKLDEKDFDSEEDLKYKVANFVNIQTVERVKPTDKTVPNAAKILKAVEEEADKKASKKASTVADLKEAIVVDEDLQKYFPDSESVNKALRGLVELFPKEDK